jgi:hypothetical protein
MPISVTAVISLSGVRVGKTIGISRRTVYNHQLSSVKVPSKLEPTNKRLGKTDEGPEGRKTTEDIGV